MMFEDIPQVCLLLFILSGTLRCGNLTDPEAVAFITIKKYTIIKLTFIGTVSNIVKTVFSLRNDARSLNENALLYMMTRMTANNKWFPFIHEFQTHKIERNVFFTDIKVHLPYITDAFGKVSYIEFQFVDTTL